MSEAGVKDRAVAQLRALGWWAVRIAASPYQTMGLPDVLVALHSPRGRGLWLEFKQPGKTATKIQLARMAELEDAGFETEIVYTVDDALLAVARCEAQRLKPATARAEYDKKRASPWRSRALPRACNFILHDGTYCGVVSTVRDLCPKHYIASRRKRKGETK